MNYHKKKQKNTKKEQKCVTKWVKVEQNGAIITCLTE